MESTDYHKRSIELVVFKYGDNKNSTNLPAYRGEKNPDMCKSVLTRYHFHGSCVHRNKYSLLFLIYK